MYVSLLPFLNQLRPPPLPPELGTSNVMLSEAIALLYFVIFCNPISKTADRQRVRQQRRNVGYWNMYGDRPSKDMGLDRENRNIFLSSMVRVSSNVPPQNRNRFIFRNLFCNNRLWIRWLHRLTMTEWPKHVANFCKKRNFCNVIICIWIVYGLICLRWHNRMSSLQQ